MGDRITPDALADAIQIGDITSNESDSNILWRLKKNDPNFTTMCLSDDDVDVDNYCPKGARDMEWRGYYVKEIHM